MARHRTLLRAARRGVARWPLVTIGVLLVLLVAWLGWRHADVVMQRQAAAQAASCPEGEATLTIAVSPPAADVMERAATTWTRSRPVVQDHCIRTEVTPIPPQAVLDGLADGWTAAPGPRPAAWLPESSLWVDRLRAQHAELIGSQPTSIATSPLVLAMPDQAAAAFGAGGAVRWADLPTLVAAPDGWSRHGHAEWGRFTVALPDPAHDPASTLALQAVLAGVGARDGGPLTADQIATPSAGAALRSLAAAAPPSAPATTDDALTALGAAVDIRSAPFDAVPTFEYDLYRRNASASADDQSAPYRPLTGVTPGGPTPAADFPFVAIAGDGTDHVAARAAQEFRELLQSSPQQLELAKAGLRAAGSKVRPTTAPGIRWADPTQGLPPADAGTTEQLAAAWSTAGDRGRVVTVLVDVSGSMQDSGGGGQSRLDWLKAALAAQIDRFDAGALGLWEFSRGLGPRDEPYRQLAGTAPVARQRADLRRAVAGLQPHSATYLYPSVLAAYESALRHYQDGRDNRLLLITDGPDDSPMTYRQFSQELTALASGRYSVPVDVIAIGPDPDRTALAGLAEVTGGAYTAVPDGAGLQATLDRLLNPA